MRILVNIQLFRKFVISAANYLEERKLEKNYEYSTYLKAQSVVCGDHDKMKFIFTACLV